MLAVYPPLLGGKPAAAASCELTINAIPGQGLRAFAVAALDAKHAEYVKDALLEVFPEVEMPAPEAEPIVSLVDFTKLLPDQQIVTMLS